MEILVNPIAVKRIVPTHNAIFAQFANLSTRYFDLLDRHGTTVAYLCVEVLRDRVTVSMKLPGVGNSYTTEINPPTKQVFMDAAAWIGARLNLWIDWDEIFPLEGEK